MGVVKIKPHQSEFVVLGVVFSEPVERGVAVTLAGSERVLQPRFGLHQNRFQIAIGLPRDFDFMLKLNLGRIFHDFPFGLVGRLSRRLKLQVGQDATMLSGSLVPPRATGM